MKIGVLSDTHLSKEDLDNQSPIFLRLQTICNLDFHNIDYIIHAGDTIEYALVDFFKRYAPTIIVHGNCDIGEKIEEWPEIAHLEFEGIRIAVAHERPMLYKLIKEPIQIFIFGHSHIPFLDEFEPGRFWLNPGSVKRPSGPNPRPSIAIIEIHQGKIKIEHRYF